jgi:ribosome maturation factor RimP
MANEAAIADLLAPVAESLGFEIVRVRVIRGRGQTLQVMAERPDGTMDVDDCASLSRAFEAVLDAADPINGEYALEVSSPGIDRPLTRAKDFAHWAGHAVKIELKSPDADGRKRFAGDIKSADAGTVTLVMPKGKTGEEITLLLSAIEAAKLVMTDRLLAAARAAAEARKTA